MATLTIPTSSDPFQKQTVRLDGIDFVLSLSYNQREERWYVSMKLSPIASRWSQRRGFRGRSGNDRGGATPQARRHELDPCRVGGRCLFPLRGVVVFDRNGVLRGNHSLEFCHFRQHHPRLQQGDRASVGDHESFNDQQRPQSFDDRDLPGLRDPGGLRRLLDGAFYRFRGSTPSVVDKPIREPHWGLDTGCFDAMHLRPSGGDAWGDH